MGFRHKVDCVRSERLTGRFLCICDWYFSFWVAAAGVNTRNPHRVAKGGTILHFRIHNLPLLRIETLPHSDDGVNVRTFRGVLLLAPLNEPVKTSTLNTVNAKNQPVPYPLVIGTPSHVVN